MYLLKKTAMIMLTTVLIGGIAVAGHSLSSDKVVSELEKNTAIYAHDESSDETKVFAQKKQQSSTAENEEKQTAEPEKKIDIIKLNKESLSLGKGESYELKTNVNAVKWESDNEKIVKVTDGKIKANSNGTATVKAYDENGNVSECKLTVKDAPDSVSFDKYELTLGVGESYKLSAVIPNGAAAKRIFTSSDQDILKVTKSDWQGEFKAVKPGVAYAVVKLYNGREASCEITVKEAPEKITISRAEITLGVGESFRLGAAIPAETGAAKRTYRSSDNKIIRMTRTDWAGEFKAVSEGTAWVTVRSYNGKESSCKIIVKKAPESVSLSKNTLELTTGQHYTLTCDVNDGAASSIKTFRSSDSSIVEMTKTEGAGAFTTVAEGTAWVTARTYNGIEKSCKIVVKNKPQRNSNEADGETYSEDSDNTNENTSGRVSSSDDNNNWNGSNTGGGHTTAPDGTPWTASTDNTIVYTDNNMISLTNNVAVLDPGDNYSIELSGSSSGTVSYSSGDDSVATVGEDGTVTAIGNGNTNIYIKDDSGNVGKLEVIVLGSRNSCIYPDMYSVTNALDNTSLNPLKTNYQPIDDMIDGIFSEILTDGMSNSEKVQACYDYLAQNCTYGYDGYKAVSIDGYYSDEDKEIAEFSYCILKDQLGTCENFSAAFVVMMRRLGYEANQIYGDVAMSAGGYDGHYWADVEIDGKHYLFDPQVERNCLGEDKAVMHYFFGMDPENNYSMYRYNYMTCVHGFKGR